MTRYATTACLRRLRWLPDLHRLATRAAAATAAFR